MTDHINQLEQQLEDLQNQIDNMGAGMPKAPMPDNPMDEALQTELIKLVSNMGDMFTSLSDSIQLGVEALMEELEEDAQVEQDDDIK